MKIPYNTMPLRGLPARVLKFTAMEEVMLREKLNRQSGAMPAWYYEDSYDEPDPNAPTHYEAMLGGDLR